jgi:hypothetical protein
MFSIIELVLSDELTLTRTILIDTISKPCELIERVQSLIGISRYRREYLEDYEEYTDEAMDRE